MASVYPHRFKMEPKGSLERIFYGALAVHNYQEAALVIQSINDFLKGPELMNEGAEIIHQSISGLAKKYAPKNVDDLEGLHPVIEKPMPAGKFKLTNLIVKRIRAVMLMGGKGKRRQPRLCMDNQANIATIGNFPYVKTNGPRSYKLLYQPDTPTLLKLLWKGYLALRAYHKQGEAAAVMWRAGITELRGQERWDQIFRREVTSHVRDNQTDVADQSPSNVKAIAR
jgi:hypothetical protein